MRLAKGWTQPKAAQEISRIQKISLKHYKFLELGQSELKLRWAEPIAKAFGTTPQRIMFGEDEKPHIESSDVMGFQEQPRVYLDTNVLVRELDTRAGLGGGGVPSREVRREGDYADPLKAEGWQLPPSYLREIGAPASHLIVLEGGGDSMYPTIASGDRLIADTRHKQPTPDGIYALRDSFDAIIIKRLQLLRTKPPRVKIISDNPNHPAEEVGLDEIDIVGKVIVGLKRF